ncbi:DUF3017 domain-containing protein [Pseudactinotalea sp. Z1732]|uniref:DUF3017 domain-containing protein n=1 Tax=Micrococcales TaxID=85006 RepID=UPI003C7A1BF6
MSRNPAPEIHRPPPPRTWALWWALGGVVVAVLLALMVGARVAGVAFAVHLGVLGAIRLALPAPGPLGISARSRLFDVAFLWLGAVGIALMALTADNL